MRSPDVVVCNSRRIIGVIELKYLPRTTPVFAKDLETLQWFASDQHPVSISNERYRGVGQDEIRKYSLAEDAVLCWAGVYTAPRVDIERHAEALGRRFLCLHSITSANDKPTTLPLLQGEESDL